MIKNIIILIVMIIIGYAFGRYVQPARVETKVETIVKEVHVIDHDTETIIKENPDGSKETIIKDKSKERTDIDKEKNSVTIIDNRALWKFAVQFTPSHPELYYFHGASVERRVLGPIFVGAFGTVDKQVGISLGLEL